MFMQSRSRLERRRVDVMELATWVYRDQKADKEFDAGVAGPTARAGALGWGEKSRDGISMVERVASVGCDIDGGGWSPGALDADAEAVHDFVLAHRLHQVMQYARTGTVPDWAEGMTTRYEPVWRGMPMYHTEGKLAGLPDENAVKRVWNDTKKHAIGSQVRCIDHPAVIASIRSEYVRWHAGMSSLAAYFMARPELLRRYEVTGFAASPTPWLDRPRSHPVRDDIGGSDAQGADVVPIASALSARARMTIAASQIVPALMAAAVLAVSIGIHEDVMWDLYDSATTTIGAGRT